MYTYIATKTFLFNITMAILFSIIYYSISPDNFEPLNPKNKLTYLDFLFYAVTIQSGIGLSDVNVISPLAKILVLVQQLVFMASAFILIHFYFKNR
jgi:hypothetical protein